MIDWAALAAPTERMTKEHVNEVRVMLKTEYTNLPGALKDMIEKDHDLSDYWYFNETPLHRRGDVWDNRRTPARTST